MADNGHVRDADGPSKSEQIRQMAAKGLSKSDIARQLGVRYQFVYNVLKAAAPVSHADTILPREDGIPVYQADGDALTITEAKRRLALTFGVDPSAITITVQG